MGESFGKYELIERIGVGGMAEVFRARRRSIEGFEKVVVVKRLLRSLADNESVARMFVAEARLCSFLSHPNIVQIHDLGVEDGLYYIVMEYVRGCDLLQVLRRAAQHGVMLSTELALHITSCIASALAYAHDATDPLGRPLRLIHRDVSPANILISASGDVKLSDFGVARFDPGGEATAQPSAVRGKLSYMAPEQVRGAPVDHRADLFALGTVLWETLTLKRLFLGRTPEQTARNVAEGRTERRFGRHDYIPAGVMAIVRRALAVDPDERYQRAADMQDDIIDYLFEHRLRVSGDRLAELIGVLVPELGGGAATTRRSPRPRSVRRDTTETGRPPGAMVEEEATDAAVAEASGPLRDARPAVDEGLGFELLDEILGGREGDSEPTGTARRHIQRGVGYLGLDDLEATGRFVFGGVLQRAWLPRIALRLRDRRATGVLCLAHDWIRKDVYLERGRVRHVRSNRQDELLALFLVARGELAPLVIEDALEHGRTHGVRLGQALLALGHIDADTLATALFDNQRARFREPFGWPGGYFAFYEDVAMPAYGLDVGFDPAPELGPALREGADEATMRRLFEAHRAQRVIPVEVDGEAAPEWVLESGLGLGIAARAAAERMREKRPRVRAILDGRGETAAALRALWLLAAADLVTFLEE